MRKTSKSSRRPPRRRGFLPNRGEASDDPDADYFLTAISVFFQEIYKGVMCIVVPLQALLRYVGSEIKRRLIP